MTLPSVKTHAAICLGAICFVGSCATDDCTDNRNSLPLAAFFDSSSGEQITLSRLTLYGLHAPGDSMLLNNASGVEEAYLPFRITEHSTTFVIDYIEPDVRDTVTFHYDPVPRFASSECGAVYDYRMESISHTSHILDSVTCPDGTITNAPGQNIRVYLRTSLPQ